MQVGKFVKQAAVLARHALLVGQHPIPNPCHPLCAPFTPGHLAPWPPPRWNLSQLETYGVISWYVEQEQPGAQSRLRSMGARDLLYQLPFLQRLQRRLLDCVPKGQTARDPVVLVSVRGGAGFYNPVVALSLPFRCPF